MTRKAYSLLMSLCTLVFSIPLCAMDEYHTGGLSWPTEEHIAIMDDEESILDNEPLSIQHVKTTTEGERKEREQKRNVDENECNAEARKCGIQAIIAERAKQELEKSKLSAVPSLQDICYQKLAKHWYPKVINVTGSTIDTVCTDIEESLKKGIQVPPQLALLKKGVTSCLAQALCWHMTPATLWEKPVPGPRYDDRRLQFSKDDTSVIMDRYYWNADDERTQALHGFAVPNGATVPANSADVLFQKHNRNPTTYTADSPQGTLRASPNAEHTTLTFTDTITNEIHSLAIPAEVRTSWNAFRMVFSDDENTFLLVLNGLALLYDTTTMTLRKTISNVYDAALGAGKAAVLLNDGKTVKIFDLTTYESCGQLTNTNNNSKWTYMNNRIIQPALYGPCYIALGAYDADFANDRALDILNIDSNSLATTLPYICSETSTAFSHSGTMFAYQTGKLHLCQQPNIHSLEHLLCEIAINNAKNMKAITDLRTSKTMRNLKSEEATTINTKIAQKRAHLEKNEQRESQRKAFMRKKFLKQRIKKFENVSMGLVIAGGALVYIDTIVKKHFPHLVRPEGFPIGVPTYTPATLLGAIGIYPFIAGMFGAAGCSLVNEVTN